MATFRLSLRGSRSSSISGYIPRGNAWPSPPKAGMASIAALWNFFSREGTKVRAMLCSTHCRQEQHPDRRPSQC